MFLNADVPEDINLAPFAIAFSKYLARVAPEMKSTHRVSFLFDDVSLASSDELILAAGKIKRRMSRRLSRNASLLSSLSGSLVFEEDGLVVDLTLYDKWDICEVVQRPASFDVLVIVTMFNEQEIASEMLARLTQSGARVHVIDNWSTDGTLDVIKQFTSTDSVTWERFPVDGPSGCFELERLLTRVEEVAADSNADWVVHHDTDEIRQSPWPGVSLVDGLWAVDQFGFNCIDHTVLNFRPIDNSWKPGMPLETTFGWCEFGDTPADFLQIKGWKLQPNRLTMARKGGHEVDFAGRKVFPYKFLLRHYPIRSQEHGERKILRERQPRWSPEEREKGWHVHYDHYNESTSFLWDEKDLIRWDQIDQGHFLQRLSGVGLPNNPWIGEGPNTWDLPV